MAKVLVDKDFLEDGLELICNSIRLKTGGTGVLAFPVEIKDAVDSIETSGGITPTGTKSITENGTGIDVTTFAAVDVNVPQGITPTGTKSITENGTGIDVTSYAAVDVNVPQGITPTGTKTITENGTGIDVTAYAAVNVQVEGAAQVFDVTLTEAGRSLTAQNADVGSVSGFMLYPVSGVTAAQENTIYAAWCWPQLNGVYLNVVRYYYSGSYRETSSTRAFPNVVYDSSAHTVTVTLNAGPNITLKPGQYKMIIW